MKLRIALNSVVIAALVLCAWVVSGCNSAPKPQDRIREIKKAVKAYKREIKNLEGDSKEPLKLKKWKLSVRMHTDVVEWLKYHPEAKGTEIINPCLAVLKMAVELNPQYSLIRYRLAECLKEKGSYHDNRSDWFGSLAEGFVFHKPTRQWRKVENPPSAEQVAEWRKLEKQEKEKARPFLQQALQQTKAAAQIAKAATPAILLMQGKIYLLLGKPLEAHEIYLHLSQDQHLSAKDQIQLNKLAEAIKSDPGYKKAMQKRNRRGFSP